MIDPEKPQLGKILPDSSPLQHTPLLTNPMITDLKEHVRIVIPWENHYKFIKPATGLPSQEIIYAYIKVLKHNVNSIPEKNGRDTG